MTGHLQHVRSYKRIWNCFFKYEIFFTDYQKGLLFLQRAITKVI